MKLQIAITHFMFWLKHFYAATLEYGNKCQLKEQLLHKETYGNNMFEKIHDNMKLQGTIIESIPSQSSLNCVHRCKRVGKCRFINHNRQSEVCELIEGAPESVVNGTDWNVFEKLEPSNSKVTVMVIY